MSITVGINGFGRIGRNIMRAALHVPDINVVAVNDLTDAATLAHLLKYDSILGNLSATISASGDQISASTASSSRCSSSKDPAALPWKNLGVDVVFEGTGKFTKGEDAAKHLSAGARRVIVTAPGKGVDLTGGHGRQPHAIRPEEAPRDLERVLHDQLPRSGRNRLFTSRSASRRAG